MTNIPADRVTCEHCEKGVHRGRDGWHKHLYSSGYILCPLWTKPDPCLYGQKDCPGGSQCVCAPPAANKQLDPLAIFGRMVLEEFRNAYSDLDGGWLQDAAVKCGLLTPVEVTSENICRKASDMGQIEDGAYCECEIGDLCYRLTDAAKVVTVDVEAPIEKMIDEVERDVEATTQSTRT